MQINEFEISGEENGKRVPPETVCFWEHALRKAREMHQRGLKKIQVKAWHGKVYHEPDFDLSQGWRSEERGAGRN